MQQTDAQRSFHELGLAPALLESLARMRLTVPTPIQEQAIPGALEGKDIVGVAQTGTGKTLAFGLPMIQRLAQIEGQGLILLPTRELALQVDESLRRIGEQLGLKTVVLIGGTPMGPQVQGLLRKPRVIIATPGRLIDHLEQKRVNLSNVVIVVLDEADRMLDMGFQPQIERIFKVLPHERQTLLFSATMPREIMKIASQHMKLPVRVEVAPTGTTAERVTQELFVVQRDAKNRLLEKLLGDYHGTALIFTRTKHGAKRLAGAVRSMGCTASEIHSNRTLSQRKEALQGFKLGKYRVLVATDIASRGIHVAGIGLVVNYDIPTNPEDYIHRIGRTARAGLGGHAVSFVSPDQRGELHAIESLIHTRLPISQLPELPPDRPQVYDARSERPSSFSHPRRPYDSRPRSARPRGYPPRNR